MFSYTLIISSLVRRLDWCYAVKLDTMLIYVLCVWTLSPPKQKNGRKCDNENLMNHMTPGY